MFKHPDLPEPFPWGPVVSVQKIQDRFVVEHLPELYRAGRALGIYDETDSTYTVINSKGHYEGSDTIEGALLIVVAQLTDSEDMLPAAAKLLNVVTDKEDRPS